MKLTTSAILILVIMSAMTGCKPSGQNTANQTGEKIPGVPREVLEKLFNECTSIDYIFHTLPFSLSQDEVPSIQQNVTYIDYNKPLGTIPTQCKAFARKFYKIGAEIVYDVDVYFSEGCQFYVFVKDNKPVYANYMTADGVAFYNKIINMVNAQTTPNQ